MAFLKSPGEVTPEEGLLFTYWLTVLQLLKLGIPWIDIMNFSDTEIKTVLGIEMAINQKQQEEQARAMAANQSRMRM
jgi:hypothetical protein